MGKQNPIMTPLMTTQAPFLPAKRRRFVIRALLGFELPSAGFRPLVSPHDVLADGDPFDDCVHGHRKADRGKYQRRGKVLPWRSRHCSAGGFVPASIAKAAHLQTPQRQLPLLTAWLTHEACRGFSPPYGHRRAVA